MTRTLGRWIVVLVGFFVLFFLMGLMFLLLVPLSLERAAGFAPSLPLGLWSQVRLAAIFASMFAGLCTFALLVKKLEARLDLHSPALRHRRRSY